MIGYIQDRWRALWSPELFHGWHKKSQFFEGWYFKVVDQKQENALAFIPGYAVNQEGKKHCFIQVLDGVNEKSEYYTFDPAVFHSNKKQFQVSIGKNQFSHQGIRLDLPDYRGKIQFGKHVLWPQYLYAPGIMGWYSFVPFMECYHAIISMDHTLSGNIQLQGKNLDFNQGKGYTEKDWGTSFPKCWIWMQSNHFDSPDPISLTASVAHIPWLGKYFIGFIAGLYWKGKIYRYATYTGAKMKASISNNKVNLAFKKGNTILEINANKTEGVELSSPISGDMIGKVNESLKSHIEFKFIKNNKVLCSHKADTAGLEVAGHTDILLSNKWTS